MNSCPAVSQDQNDRAELSCKLFSLVSVGLSTSPETTEVVPVVTRDHEIVMVLPLARGTSGTVSVHMFSGSSS